MEEKRIENQLREESAIKKKNELDEYMRFMMLAQLQNMTSLQNLTFEQWRGNLITVLAVHREVKDVKQEKDAEPSVEQPKQTTFVEQEISRIATNLQAPDAPQTAETPIEQEKSSDISISIEEPKLPKVLMVEEAETDSGQKEPEEVSVMEVMELLTVEQPKEENVEQLTEEHPYHTGSHRISCRCLL